MRIYLSEKSIPELVGHSKVDRKAAWDYARGSAIPTKHFVIYLLSCGISAGIGSWLGSHIGAGIGTGIAIFAFSQYQIHVCRPFLSEFFERRERMSDFVRSGIKIQGEQDAPRNH